MPCRRARDGTCVALADKLETLVGLFGVGEKPTGERDPLPCADTPSACLRMLKEEALPLDLGHLVDRAITAFPARRAQGHRIGAQRTRGILYRPARRPVTRRGLRGAADRCRAGRRVAAHRSVPLTAAAVRAFMELPEAASLASANKRIDNILKKVAGMHPVVSIASLLLEPAERALGAAFFEVQPRPSAVRLAATSRRCSVTGAAEDAGRSLL